jgi:hypothetical protein
MSRRTAAVLLCAAVMLAVVGTIDAAPAPLPKRAKEETLLQQVRKLIHAHGGRLHEMRPGPYPHQWSLIVSTVHAPSGTFDTGPIPVQRLTNPDFIGCVVEAAEIEEEERNLLPVWRPKKPGGRFVISR